MHLYVYRTGEVSRSSSSSSSRALVQHAREPAIMLRAFQTGGNLAALTAGIMGSGMYLIEAPAQPRQADLVRCCPAFGTTFLVCRVKCSEVNTPSSMERYHMLSGAILCLHMTMSALFVLFVWTFHCMAAVP